MRRVSPIVPLDGVPLDSHGHDGNEVSVFENYVEQGLNLRENRKISGKSLEESSVSITISEEKWNLLWMQTWDRAQRQEEEIASLKAHVKAKKVEEYFGPDPAEDSRAADPAESSLVWNLNAM